jgi:hypothetical protein
MNYSREGASIYPPPPGYCRTPEGLRKSADDIKDAVVYAADAKAPEMVESQSGVSQEPVKPEPLAKQYQRLLDELRESANKAGKLGEIYKLCFGEEPNYARLGKLAKEGGAGRLAQQLWQLSADRPAGDVLDYITKTQAAKRKAGANGTNGGTNGNHHEQEPDAEFLQSFRAAQGRGGGGG